MPVAYTCPFCRVNSLASDAEAAGRITCPHCKKPLYLPGQPERIQAAEPIFDAPPANASAPPQIVYVETRERRRRFRCPFCGCEEIPRSEYPISAAGWVLFVLLLLSFLFTIFCWIPLLFLRDETRRCWECGSKLG